MLLPITVTLMSLNLHAYHPMNEERRVAVNLQGKAEIADSDLFSFAPDEVRRGLQARQAQLAQDISSLRPDLIFLQEVGGGTDLVAPKTCKEFSAANTALDLERRLPSYQLHAACRGNIGWWTDSKTFAEYSIYSEKSKTKIFGTGSNPYPNGMVVEGLAVLASPQIAVVDERQVWIPYGTEGASFFVQWLKIRLHHDSSNRFWLVVNIHGKRDIEHFEVAVALRKAITQYLLSQTDRTLFAGLIVAGDFNAYSPDLEPSTVPWSNPTNEPEPALKARILQFNLGLRHPLPAAQVSARADAAISQFKSWKSMSGRLPGDDSLADGFRGRSCTFPLPRLNPICTWPKKIDHFFLSESIQVKAVSGFYSQNNWKDLAGTTSDHPGIWAQLSL